MNIGSCEFWNPKPFIDAANILTAADEPLLALKLLDIVPAFYRDYKDSEIEELKIRIKRRLVTSVWYSNCHNELLKESDSIAMCKGTLRGQMMIKELEALKKLKIEPHIIEFAPGEYWLPIGLLALGYKFTYESISLNKETTILAENILPWSMERKGKLNIYCAFEIIEHLHFVDDIITESLRLGVRPDIIHLSTPLYTFDGRKESLAWENKDLGHIRAYTPREFYDFVSKMFYGYELELQLSQVMHLRGCLKLLTNPNI